MTRLLSHMGAWSKKIQRLIMITTTAFIIASVGTAAAMRYIFGKDLYGAEEFITIAAFWMYFMGAVYATHTRSHITAEIFSTLCRNAFIRRGVYLFAAVTTIGLSLLYTWWGWEFFYWSLTEGGKTTVWQVPLVVGHTAVFLGFVGMSWYFVQNFVEDVADILNIEIRIGSQYPAEHPASQSIKTLKKLVEDGSDLNISLHLDSELGDYTHMYEDLSRGTLGMALISVPSQLDPRLETAYIHGLVTDYAQARKVYAPGSPLFAAMERFHAEQNVKFLGFHMQGFGGLLFTGENAPQPKPGGQTGLSLRVPPMHVFGLSVQALGYESVSIPFTSLETALERRQVEGVSGLPTVATYLKFRQWTRAFLPARLFMENTSYLMSMQLWKSLKPEQQVLVQDAVTELSRRSLEESKSNEERYTRLLREAGVQVIDVDRQTAAGWAEHIRAATWPELFAELGKDVQSCVEDSLALIEQPKTPPVDES